MGKITPLHLTIFGLLIILFAIFYFTFNFGSSDQRSDKLPAIEKTRTTVKINDVSIEAEIADTPATRTSGLSFREELTDDQGMLFVFDKADYHSFWMKDMNFPIDIIWIHDNHIVDLTKNIPPEKDKDLTIYKPKNPVKLVLEVNAGFSEKNSFKIGDSVKIKD